MANLEGGDGSGGGILIREYRKGNWSVNETMVLIEAKRMDDERRMKRSNDPNEARIKPAEPRWKWVEDYCWRRECLRSQNQCNDKWDNLMRDYKKVREYERRISAERSSRDGGGSGSSHEVLSYWKLEKNERKERNLPSNMLPHIYEALVEVVERPAGGGGHVSVATSNPNQTYALEIPPLPTITTATSTTAVSSNLVHHYDPHSSLPRLLQHPTEADPIMALPLPLPRQQPLPPPSQAQPPPISLPYYQAPLPIVDSDKSEEDQYSESPSKRRRRRGGGGGGEGTSTAAGSSSEHEVVMGSAITRSAKTIAEAIKANEESEERRHRELLSMHERRLKIEESKVEVNKDGLHGLVDAINNLANSVLALASHNKNTHS